ncbi:hypothetical protein CYMTET_47017 [Cymbomonas tetramitiformis]|uniref:Uncharacterized protein n=1 Tax=Cymbomonas tetramitiformis TaxID=36881 RepID=A0AAE0BWK4_9CHLO|nr:hypothetical protein CYMTET_47572 [Cymbomonas tetramitiformis]KAK3243319.1 hypothetical protein CYMTET_47017 [Cymbomonas tetramitiformis]
MANTATLAAKERGTKAYKNENFVAAVVAYSEALAAASDSDPDRHLYYSNRCAAHLNLGKFDDALADAEGCVRLKPDWAKGWSRLGGCLMRKARHQEAVVALEKAVNLDPANNTAMELLEEARRSARREARQNPQQNPQQGSSSTSQPSQSWSMPSMPSLPFDVATLQAWFHMAWFNLQQNKQLMYGLIAVIVYLVFFRSSGYSGGYSDFGYGGYGGFLGTGYDLWTIGGIALVGWVAYKKGWHRNIQNMDPMTMLFLFNTLSNLLGRRGGGGYGRGYGGGYGGGMGGYGRRGYGRRGIF